MAKEDFDGLSMSLNKKPLKKKRYWLPDGFENKIFRKERPKSPSEFESEFDYEDYHSLLKYEFDNRDVDWMLTTIEADRKLTGKMPKLSFRRKFFVALPQGIKNDVIRKSRKRSEFKSKKDYNFHNDLIKYENLHRDVDWFMTALKTEEKLTRANKKHSDKRQSMNAQCKTYSEYLTWFVSSQKNLSSNDRIHLGKKELKPLSKSAWYLKIKEEKWEKEKEEILKEQTPEW